MATFKKVGKRWEAQLCVNKIRASKTFDTKARAQSWAFEKEAELRGMSEGESPVHTLGDALRRYRDEVSAKKKTAPQETVRIDRFCKFDIAKIRLCDIRREHMEEWVAKRSTEVAYSSVNRELNILSHCFTMCRRWNWMTRNPMKDLARPSNPRPRDRRITQDEIAQLAFALNYREGEPITQLQQCVFLAFLFAIETAMRAGEICGIRAEHVDYAKKTVYLPETKNGFPRYVPLSKEAIRILKLLPETDGTLFGVGSNSLTTLFRKGLARTPITDLKFHDTRHEGITRLAKKLDVLDLARVTGHRDLNMLMVYYNKTAAELADQLN